VASVTLDMGDNGAEGAGREEVDVDRLFPRLSFDDGVDDPVSSSGNDSHSSTSSSAAFPREMARRRDNSRTLSSLAIRR